jgi:hypothetical protein
MPEIEIKKKEISNRLQQLQADEAFLVRNLFLNHSHCFN